MLFVDLYRTARAELLLALAEDDVAAAEMAAKAQHLAVQMVAVTRATKLGEAIDKATMIAQIIDDQTHEDDLPYLCHSLVVDLRAMLAAAELRVTPSANGVTGQSALIEKMVTDQIASQNGWFSVLQSEVVAMVPAQNVPAASKTLVLHDGVTNAEDYAKTLSDAGLGEVQLAAATTAKISSDSTADAVIILCAELTPKVGMLLETLRYDNQSSLIILIVAVQKLDISQLKAIKATKATAVITLISPSPFFYRQVYGIVKNARRQQSTTT